MFTALVLTFSLGYVLLLGMYLRAWRALPQYRPHRDPDSGPPVFMSVIIPARDEAPHIAACLQSIAGQEYPPDRFEIILVDDHSTDDTAEVAESLGLANLRVIRLAELPLRDGEVAYKKRAIETGVSAARGECIATTDADCSHHAHWLRTLAAAFADLDADILSGPVLFQYRDNLFQQFQALDFLGMIGITAASLRLGMFNLANGANLAFRKSAFEAVGGYAGIDRQASGDDMLLIYKIAQRDPGKVHFLKSTGALVYTRPAAGPGEFVQQRLRWTSKSFSYQDKRITWILAFVYLTNLLLPAGLLAWAVTGRPWFAWLALVQFALMSAADWLFLREMCRFFDRRGLMKAFFPAQVMHVVYIISIGLLGNLVPYRWKGRKLR